MKYGLLAATCGFPGLPLTVCESSHGFYLGTKADGLPVSRESVEYFGERLDAQRALETGTWTQRNNA